MPSKLRVERIAARIREEISEMFVTGQITDPRLNQVFVTDVTVEPWLSTHKVVLIIAAH